MALSCSSVHVHFGADPPSDAQQQVTDAVRAAVPSRFVEAAADELSDREIIVTTCENGWVSVLDQQKSMALAGAEVLSRELSVPVVGLWMDDQDFLILRLASAGRVVDDKVMDWRGFLSPPGDISVTEDRGSGPFTTTATEADAWAAVLPDGVSPDELAAVWINPDPFPEEGFDRAWLPDVMHRLASLRLNIPSHSVCGWYGWAMTGTGATRLRYRFADRPATAINRDEGAPRLDEFRYSGNLPLHLLPQTLLPGPRQTLGRVETRSVGGPGTGFVVSVSGDAITSGLLDAKTAVARVGRFAERPGPLVATDRHSERVAWIEMPIPAHYVTPPDWASRDIYIGDQGVVILIEGSTTGRGTGSLTIEISPIGVPDKTISVTTEVTVPGINAETILGLLQSHPVGEIGDMVAYAEYEKFPDEIIAEIAALGKAIKAEDGAATLLHFDRLRTFTDGTHPMRVTAHHRVLDGMIKGLIDGRAWAWP